MARLFGPPHHLERLLEVWEDAMKISLSGRAAIVTGGSKGIGFAVATRFAASGADVAIVARTGEPLREGVAAIRKSTQTRVIGVQADVSKAADIQRAYDDVMKTFDKVDIIVNNAGTSRAMPFDKIAARVRWGASSLKSSTHFAKPRGGRSRRSPLPQTCTDARTRC
jgi:NAD(P)-dependent dehydrogenase (short-subunit alcohol dehydrogenase family)